jgi:hypothetical protein
VQIEVTKQSLAAADRDAQDLAARLVSGVRIEVYVLYHKAVENCAALSI